MSDFKCPMCVDCPDNCPLDAQDIDTRKCTVEWNMGYQQGRADEIEECIDILKGIDKQVADIFENIVMNAEHYNKKGK